MTVTENYLPHSLPSLPFRPQDLITYEVGRWIGDRQEWKENVKLLYGESYRISFLGRTISVFNGVTRAV